MFSDLTGVIIQDRYQNYDKFPGVAHEFCAARLLRDLADAAQSYPGAIWPGQAAEAVQALIHHANLARGGLAAVPPETAAPHLRLFRRGVRVGLAQVCRIPGGNVEQPPGADADGMLRDREDDVLRCLSDLRIPPTLNGAEQYLRPAKTQQKISGRLCWEQATRHRYAFGGCLSTAAKRSVSIFAALRDALAGNPWMPSIPGLA